MIIIYKSFFSIKCIENIGIFVKCIKLFSELWFNERIIFNMFYISLLNFKLFLICLFKVTCEGNIGI